MLIKCIINKHNKISSYAEAIYFLLIKYSAQVTDSTKQYEYNTVDYICLLYTSSLIINFHVSLLLADVVKTFVWKYAQQTDETCACLTNRSFHELHGSPVSPWSVSYTHLDVYKRQAYKSVKEN